MKKRAVLIGAVVTAVAVAPVAHGFRIAPLKQRDATVIHWRAKNKVAVVAQPNGRLLAIHSVRRVTPGTRVTVNGIKWGTPTRGIKWSAPARGIKWGIKWGRNGTYQSPVISKRGVRKAVWTPVRGPIVKKFGRKAVAIGTPGAVVVVRIGATRGSSSFSREMGLPSLPPVGATISMRLYPGQRGIKIARNIQYLKPPVPGAKLPVAGTIQSINRTARTMVLFDGQDPAYKLRLTVAIPQEFALDRYGVGQDIAVEGRPLASGAIAATQIAPNGTFSAGDNPGAIQVLTTGEPACTQSTTQECPTAPASDGATPPSGAPPPSSPSTDPPPPPAGGGETPPGGDGTPPGGGETPPTPPSCIPWPRPHHTVWSSAKAKRVKWCRPPCASVRPKDERRRPTCRPGSPTRPSVSTRPQDSGRTS